MTAKILINQVATRKGNYFPGQYIEDEQQADLINSGATLADATDLIIASAAAFIETLRRTGRFTEDQLAGIMMGAIYRRTLVGIPGPPGPGTWERVEFSYDTPSPMVIGSVQAGALVYARVILTEPFSDAAASLTFGTSIDTQAFVRVGEVWVGGADQFAFDEMVLVPTNDIMLFSIAPAASLTGAGFLMYGVVAP